MDKTRFSTSEGTVSLDVVHFNRDCSCCANASCAGKHGSHAETESCKLWELRQAKTPMETPEQREQFYALLDKDHSVPATDDLHETLNPQPRDRMTMENLFKFERPEVIDEGAKSLSPEELAQRRTLHATLNPQPRDKSTMEDLFAFKRPAVINEREEEPSAQLVVDETRRILRGFDTQNLIAATVVARARFIQGDRLVTSCEEHKQRIREEWTQELVLRRGKRE